MKRFGLLILTPLLLTMGLTPKITFAIPDGPPFGVYENVDFSPSVTILESSSSQIRFSLSMDNLPTGEELDLTQVPPGLWGEMNETGSLIPRFTLFFALPPTGNPTIFIEEWNVDTLDAVARNIPENSTPPPSVLLGSVGILGGVRVVPVIFRPIAYHNSDTICTAMSDAIIQINIDDSQGENPVSNPPLGFSIPWKELYRAVITNWEYIPNYDVTFGSHILMIVPDVSPNNYIPNLQDFIRWKEQRGIKVTIVPKSSIGSNPSANQIRSRILAESETADPPIDFVILVGDETQLSPQYQFTNDPLTRFSTEQLQGSYTSEGYFAELYGNDVFPDVFVGRWVVNNGTTEVSLIAAKSILHEKDPFAVDSMRFERATIAADNTELSQKETKRHVRSELFNHGFGTVDSVFISNGTTRMTNLVNLGQTFVNYRGSGWDFGWAGIHFYVINVPDLNNSKKMPIVTGIGCGVGMFNGGSSGFAEAWMLAGTISQPKGSVGFIGPCWNTHTVYNDCLDSLLYRAWLNYDVLQLAPGLVAGKMMEWALLAQFLGESPVLEVTRTLFRQYMVQGDPSLQVYTDTPVRPQVILPEEIPGDPSGVEVAVTNMGSLPAESLNATIWIGDGDFVTGWITGENGSVSIPVEPAGADSVVITVTGENVLAYQATLPVGPSHVAPVPQVGIPTELELGQNYPNPFNSVTSIRFGLPVSGQVSLEIFDILGKHVATLVNSNLSAGRYQVQWTGLNDAGTIAGSGVFFYRLASPTGTLVHKLVFVR